MTPEEFDIDFDFDNEYGFSNNSGKSDAESDDFDLDAALARELGPDFDALFEMEYAAAQAALNAGNSVPAEFDQTRFFNSFDDTEAPGADDSMAFLPEEDEDDLSDEAAEMTAAFAAAAAAIQTPEQPPKPVELNVAEEPEELEVFDEAEEAEEAEEPEIRRPVRRERRQRRSGFDIGAVTEKIRGIDLTPVGEKFSAAGQVIAENSRSFVDALKDCKPGKMDKKQKRRFKNDVLPFLIGAAAVVVCLSFIIGSIGRNFDNEDRQQAAIEESLAQAEQEAAAAAQIKNILDTAAAQAARYDYQAAITTIDSYADAASGRELTEEMTAARTLYTEAMTDLVVWDDPAAIANLSFHVLIEDSVRAYADTVYGSSYRTKFITTADFSAILEDLYANGYVLVNLDSCIAESKDAAGVTTYTTKPIYLPSGKTPVMITETLVNYFAYMVDGNDDGVADADGAGFASRLVISGGEIKAEYIDAQGQTHVGDYDLVPILNSFIETHPDFSYRGAKAILAVTGSEGVFGWPVSGDEAAANSIRDIAEILRADGYQIASNSYDNLDYSGRTSVEQINTDLNNWATRITPILGEVDIMVIAKGSGIKTRGSGFQAMEAAGFHYILDCTDTPGGELTSEYFHQHRIMVTGEELTSGAYDAYFTIMG